MAEEVWEIDFEQATLNDLIILEEGAAAFGKGDFGAAKGVRDLLGRLIVGKTAEDIGNIPLGTLWKLLDSVSVGIKDIVPKANDTPS